MLYDTLTRLFPQEDDSYLAHSVYWHLDWLNKNPSQHSRISKDELVDQFMSRWRTYVKMHALSLSSISSGSSMKRGDVQTKLEHILEVLITKEYVMNSGDSYELRG